MREEGAKEEEEVLSSLLDEEYKCRFMTGMLKWRKAAMKDFKGEIVKFIFVGVGRNDLKGYSVRA